MFERFTTTGRSIVVRAQDEARTLHHAAIGSQHLLLALAATTESTAERALLEHGVTYDQVHAAVLRHDSVGRHDGADPMPFTPDAKKAIELSLREAFTMKSAEIGTPHLLLGVLQAGDGLGAAILRDHGFHADTLRPRLVQLGFVHPDVDRIPRQHTRPTGVPRCPRCSAPLDRPLHSVASTTDGAGAVTLVCCPACDATLGVLPA